MYIPIFLLLVLFAGLRDQFVGTDAGNYVKIFESTTGMDDIYQKMAVTNYDAQSDIKTSLLSEPGYTLLNIIAKAISTDYWALFIIIAMVVIGCYLLAFSRFSDNVPISLFVLITMGWYFFFFNGARQGIAAAIYTLSFGSLLNRNFKNYCLWIILAMFFHRSIVCAIPLYFLFIRPNDLKQNIIIFLLGVFIILFMKNIIGIASETISETYAGYAEVENTGGKFYALFYFVLGIGFLFAKRYIAVEDRVRYDTYLNMILFGALIYVAVLGAGLTQNLMRFAFYFIIAGCFAWPILLRNLNGRNVYSLAMAVFFAGSFIYYVLIVPKTGLNLYKFNEWVQPYLSL